jgi:hypothetical protein
VVVRSTSVLVPTALNTRVCFHHGCSCPGPPLNFDPFRVGKRVLFVGLPELEPGTYSLSEKVGFFGSVPFHLRLSPR